MDFSNDIFRAPSSTPRLSHDTMNHSHKVMACRFGWAVGPNDGTQSIAVVTTQSQPGQDPLVGFSRDSKTKRFAPCRGRLYHQLSCSHRVRTDLVEACGPNCLDPPTITSTLPFYCHECLEKEAIEIWSKWKAQLNDLYPPLNEMSKPQSDEWYQQYRQLETKFANEREAYKRDLQFKTRPSNVCSALEASQEEKAIADELDSLSLAMVSSSDDSISRQQGRRARISLPTDESEQLHWGLKSFNLQQDTSPIVQQQPRLEQASISGAPPERLVWNLNQLSLDRGSCGVEYSTNQDNGSASAPVFGQEELWRKPQR